MKRKRFTDQEKEELLKNVNILKVGKSNATYCPKFKIHALKEYEKGKTPTMIFVESEINLAILGKKQPEKCLNRWRKLSSQKGKESLLNETRGASKAGGRPHTRPLTLKEAEAKIAYLEAENDFLKKLKALERGLI